MKYTTKLISVVILSLLASGIKVKAQSYEDAVKTFNDGYQFVKDGRDLEAKSKFLEVISIINKTGENEENAKALKKKAEEQIAPIQFKIAGAIYKNKDVVGAIAAFEEASEAAKKYGDKTIESRVNGIIPKLYYTLGNQSFKKSELDEAVNYYNKAIEKDPNYGKAYYQLGLVYKNKDDLDATLESFDKAIEISLSARDNSTAHEAEVAARDLLVFKGVKQTEAKNFDAAIKLLEQAIEYDNEFADTYYRLAEAYNKKSVFDLAIEYSNKALQFEKGGKVDRAKIWFEKGYALKNKGNKSAACEAYEQAAYGQFKNIAQHEMEYELKCNTNTGK